MAAPISQFFERLGFPLRNVRWSWGAERDGAVLLRTWADEFSLKERAVRVLRDPSDLQYSDSYGLDERIGHLQTLWEGQAAGYTVIANAKDPKASPREVKDYRDDVVFPIEQLDTTDRGELRALLGQPVASSQLLKHAEKHLTKAGAGPFPVPLEWRTGASSDTYQQKLPALREWLIQVARDKTTVTYADVMNRFGLTFYPLRNAMSRLGHQSQEAGEPIITALIVDKDTGRCSEGLADEFGVLDDEEERQRCFAFWGAPVEHGDDVPSANPDSVDARLARFARVQVRPDQAAFREAVFCAAGGRCAVTGCAVPEALEAAHLLGRDWKAGQNSAADGLLLRRDIHALYDRGLLKISSEGLVQVHESIRPEYGQYTTHESRVSP